MMICPRWVATQAQPVGIDDVLAYLAAACHLPDGGSRTFEIGGADQASYGDLMREYARQRGLKRFLISVPLLTPHLSSLWLGLVTPVYARVGRELIAGLKNRSVVTDPAALSEFPIRPAGLREAIARAIRNESRAFAQTRWSDARSSGGGNASAGRGTVRKQAGRCTANFRGGRRWSRVRAGRKDRGRKRMVLRHVVVANQGRNRPSTGRCRDAPW